MKKNNLIDIVSNPLVYSEKPQEVRIIQTYISIVCLTGEYAYKFKKIVDFGYLNFKTLKKRKFYCYEELRLNRRLSPDLYLDVVELRHDKKSDSYSIGGDGEIVDYAVKMKELPQDYIMSELLKSKRGITSDTVKDIAIILVDFYRNARSGDEISKYGSIESFKINTDENFEQTKEFIGQTLTEKEFRDIEKATNDFYEKNKALFEKRIADGRIRECHGDLHTGNIFISDKVYIFDCIEFNERFKNSDIACDIAFLAMDLDYLGRSDLANEFVSEYIDMSGDEQIKKFINFYKCYRAYVRGKVIGFLLNDEQAKDEQKEIAIKISRKYFALAHKYANIM